jgi:hypothetical protein
MMNSANFAAAIGGPNTIGTQLFLLDASPLAV